MILYIKNLILTGNTGHTYPDSITPFLCLYYADHSKEQEAHEDRPAVAQKKINSVL